MQRTRTLCHQLGIALPIVQAPMAGAQDHDLAIAVASSGGLGSLPCAMLTSDGVRAQVRAFRESTAAPVNLNFFCHTPPQIDAEAEARWRAQLQQFYLELGIEADPGTKVAARVPFDDEACSLVEALQPEVVSFHFGLPPPVLLARVLATRARIVASATTVAEARFLAAAGCHAIIAQGAEAGGHRGMFLSTDVGAQAGTFALVPQVVDAVNVPVIAAGGIADGRGVAAALALGASGVQVGTAYLRCPESKITALHRNALVRAHDDGTRLTSLFTGRPARGLENRLMRELGPLHAKSLPFPLASAALAPLRARAEAAGSTDFSPLWAGQAAPLARDFGAALLTRLLWTEAKAVLRELGD